MEGRPKMPDKDEAPKAKKPENVARGIKSWETRDNKIAAEVSERLKAEEKTPDKAILEPDVINALRRQVGRDLRQLREQDEKGGQKDTLDDKEDFKNAA